METWIGERGLINEWEGWRGFCFDLDGICFWGGGRREREQVFCYATTTLLASKFLELGK